MDLVPLWTGHSQFRFADREVRQNETFFLVLRHSGILGPAMAGVHHRERITELRWWSVDEIEHSPEAVLPTDLADRIREHLQSTEEFR